MKLSLVLVAYRSAACLPAAIDSFRREARREGASCEVIVVEHSGEPAEVQAIERCRPDRLLVRPNRGFAAGINAGIAEASGELLLVGNPDVELHPGALARLMGALESGWDVVGPQFVLGDFSLPPADEQNPRAELGRLAAARWPRLGRRILVRQALRWCRVWEAGEPVASTALSGALIALTAEAARKVGAWDEGYFLYFEETDWLRRAARAGLRIAQVPRARVTHVWGHAADPLAFAERFDRSRRRFYRRHFGPAGGWIARRSAKLAAPRPVEPWSAAAAQTVPAGCWWLLAFSPVGLPAAGMRLDVTASSAQRGAAVEAAVQRFLTLQPVCPAPFLIGFDPRRKSLLGIWSWPADGSPASRRRGGESASGSTANVI